MIIYYCNLKIFLDKMLCMNSLYFIIAAEFSLSPDITRSIFSSFHGNSSVVVSFFRACGNLHLDSRRIQSILMFPSLPDHIKAVFTFVQCDQELMLSMSLNKQCFPEPKNFLLQFKVFFCINLYCFYIRDFLIELYVRLFLSFQKLGFYTLQK